MDQEVASWEDYTYQVCLVSFLRWGLTVAQASLESNKTHFLCSLSAGIK